MTENFSDYRRNLFAAIRPRRRKLHLPPRRRLKRFSQQFCLHEKKMLRRRSDRPVHAGPQVLQRPVGSWREWRLGGAEVMEAGAGDRLPENQKNTQHLNISSYKLSWRRCKNPQSHAFISNTTDWRFIWVINYSYGGPHFSRLSWSYLFEEDGEQLGAETDSSCRNKKRVGDDLFCWRMSQQTSLPSVWLSLRLPVLVFFYYTFGSPLLMCYSEWSDMQLFLLKWFSFERSFLRRKTILLW